MVTLAVGSALSIIIAVTAVLALRALVGRLARGPRGDHVVDTVMEPLAGVYGLLLAFMVGSVADRGLELRTALQAEADAFRRLELVAQQLPAPLDMQLQTSLQRYARTEVDARVARRNSNESATALNEIWREIISFEPRRASESVLQSEALADLRGLGEQRTIGARANRYAHGPLIWVVLLTGAASILTVCIIAGLADPHARIYLIALTTVITITLYVFYALSRPLENVSFPTLADFIR